MLLSGSATARALDAPPWVPQLAQTTDEYFPAPGFNGGRLGLDHFAGPNAADEVGVVTAALSNGDTVVAGLVPSFGFNGTCNNGTALCNIGLVRYNAAGLRVAWSNPGAFGYNGNQYVIFSSLGGGAPSFQYIRDVKVHAGTIYVMADTNAGNLSSKDVRVVAFNEDGSPVNHGLAGVFGFGNGEDFEGFYGAQIVFVPGERMIVTATGYDATGPFIAVNRLEIDQDGSLSQSTNWGQGYGGGTINRIVRYFGPGAYCGAVRCEVIASYAAGPVGVATPNDFYVGASIHVSGTDWDPIAVKISSVDGALKTEFNQIGWSRAPFNEVGSSNRDIVAGLYVYQDEVYMAAQVERKCLPGIGLAKLNGATGLYIAAFGNAGKIVFGGQGNAQFCAPPPGEDVPTAIAATGGRIGIVGYSHDGIQGTSSFYDPMLAVVDAGSGSVLDFQTHPVLDANGVRYGDAVFYGVYGGPNATSPFTVAGNGRIASAGNSLSYLVGKLIPVSADRLFADNFGSGEDSP